MSCKKGDLRGTFDNSADGFTYLAVDDNNGGYCGPIEVDGKIWQHKIGEVARIEPAFIRSGAAAK